MCLLASYARVSLIRKNPSVIQSLQKSNHLTLLSKPQSPTHSSPWRLEPAPRLLTRRGRLVYAIMVRCCTKQRCRSRGKRIRRIRRVRGSICCIIKGGRRRELGFSFCCRDGVGVSGCQGAPGDEETSCEILQRAMLSWLRTVIVESCCLYSTFALCTSACSEATSKRLLLHCVCVWKRTNDHVRWDEWVLDGRMRKNSDENRNFMKAQHQTQKASQRQAAENRKESKKASKAEVTGKRKSKVADDLTSRPSEERGSSAAPVNPRKRGRDTTDMEKVN